MNTSYNPAVDPSLNYNNTNSMNNYANDVSNLNYDTEPSTVLRPLKQYAQDNYSEDPRQFNNYNSYYHDDVGMGKLRYSDYLCMLQSNLATESTWSLNTKAKVAISFSHFKVQMDTPQERPTLPLVITMAHQPPLDYWPNLSLNTM